jgi:CRP-like cAMP-binding protein
LPPSSFPAATNRLLDRLPRRDRLRLIAACEPVPLVLSSVLCEAGRPTRHAWFPTAGFVSLLAESEGRPDVEVGMVGNEGMLGAHLSLGVAVSPQRALVQGAGAAWRIDAGLLAAELARSAPLRTALGRYVYVLMAQQSLSATCLRFHPIGQRLARWLLMSQDRAHSESFPVTHEFLAHMLGVRRAGVSAAAAILQGGDLIEYRRGQLTVLDRAGLEAASCACYAADRGTYARLL